MEGIKLITEYELFKLRPYLFVKPGEEFNEYQRKRLDKWMRNDGKKNLKVENVKEIPTR